MLKYLNLLLLFISIAIPADHSSSSLVFSVNIFGLKLLYTDILFFLVSFLNLFFKKSYSKLDLAVLGFIFYVILLSVLMTFINSYTFKQLLYDFRPILYIAIIGLNREFFNFKRNTIFFTVLFGLFIYSCICFSYFIFGSNSLVIFENAKLGRVVFHNEYFLIIGLPFVLYGIKNANFNFFERFMCLLFLASFVIKLLISMGRGITFFVGVSIIFFLIKDFKKINLKNIILYFCFFLSLFFIFNFFYKLLLGDSAEMVIEYSKSRYDTTSEGFQENQIDNRGTMIYSGIKEFFGSPIFGHGAGFTFNIDSKEWNESASFVDSSFITSLIKYGIIGTIYLYGIILYILMRIYNTQKALNFVSSDSIAHHLTMSLFLILIYTLFNSIMVASYSIIAYYWLLIWLYHNQFEKLKFNVGEKL